jgi:hypothetical protein
MRSIIIRSLGAALMLWLSAGCASMLQDGAMIGAHRKIQIGKYDLALAKLSEAEHYTPPSPLLSAEIAFLRGQCHDRAGRVPEATGAYLFTIENYPGTMYARQAKERLKTMKSAGPDAAPDGRPATSSAGSGASESRGR